MRHGMMSLIADLGAVVAIPVRNEDRHLESCLRALIDQIGMPVGSYGIVLFLNNCSDRSEMVAKTIASQTTVAIRIVVRHADHANAGWARRGAMEEAALWLDSEGASDGVILTTDADSRVAPDWIRRNLACIADGADAVAGRFVFDEVDAMLLSPGFHARLALETQYEALLTEICARLDPEVTDPWPCHRTRSGATLAVRSEVYRRVGGMPAIAPGEDHAFVEALRAHDAIVRHAPEIVVVTSARMVGRAIGGSADTIRHRCEAGDAFCDRRLEALLRAGMRTLWRRWLRSRHATGRLQGLGAWLWTLGLDQDEARRLSAYASFGKAFAEIEASSRSLAFKPLRPSALPTQIRLARAALICLRARDRVSRAGRRADTRSFALDERSAHSLPLA